MRFEFDKKDWDSLQEGEKNCFLLTNGLGVLGAAEGRYFGRLCRIRVW